MPCTFFDEPIITSHGVIFGLETNGNFISGNLPPVIQAAYIRNNQVPYMPFTNINQNSPSYSTDKQRMEAYDRIVKYNLPAVASDSKAALTFNTYNTKSSASPVSRLSYVSSSESSESKPISREQELELEKIIMEETGLNPMSCTTYADYTETTKQIKHIAKMSVEKGFTNAIDEYNSSVSKTASSSSEYAAPPVPAKKPTYAAPPVSPAPPVPAKKPTYAAPPVSPVSPAPPVPAKKPTYAAPPVSPKKPTYVNVPVPPAPPVPAKKPTYVNVPVKNNKPFGDIHNRLKLIKLRPINNYSFTNTSVSDSGSSDSVSDSDSGSSVSDSGSSVSDSDSGSSDSASVTDTDYDTMSNSSVKTPDNDESAITHVGCLINYVTKDGKRNYIMGMNSSNKYSIITQKVFIDVDTKESCITTLAKMLNSHFPLMKVPINDDTYYTDKKISGNTYRIYQIYVHEFNMNENNKKVNLLKLAGMDIGFTNFKLIPTNNTNNINIHTGELTTNLNEKIKIDYTTKNIFIN
jgi:hypothetical protein